MKNRKNTIAAMMLVLCMGIMLVACSDETVNKGENTEAVVLEFWNVFTGPDGDVMQKLIEEFNKEHEGTIKVKSRVIATESYYDKLLSSVVGGIAPDICIMHCSYIAHFAELELLCSMEEMVGNLNLNEENFVEVAWRAGAYDEIRYGIPIDVHPLGIYYNRSVLEEKGYDAPPKNLEEFLKIANDCTYDSDGDGQIDIWGFAIDPNVMSAQLFYSILYQFGGAFAENGMDDIFYSQEGIEALRLLHDMIYKYEIVQENLPTDSAIAMFEDGKLAIYCNGPWVISELENFPELEFGTAAFPKLGDKEGVWADSHNIVLPKQRNVDKEKIEAIEVFVQYLIDHEMEWAEAGHVPVLQSVLSSTAFENLEYVRPFAEQLEYVKLPYGDSEYPDKWESLCEYLPEVLLDKEWSEAMQVF